MGEGGQGAPLRRRGTTKLRGRTPDGDGDVYGTSESGGDGDRSDERKERTENFLVVERVVVVTC